MHEVDRKKMAIIRQKAESYVALGTSEGGHRIAENGLPMIDLVLETPVRDENERKDFLRQVEAFARDTALKHIP